MTPRHPLAPPGPKVPSRHPQMNWPHTARMLMLHHRHHPGAWLMVCRVTPSRRPFQPAALNANPVFNEIEVESFLRRTLPQKNQSAEKPTEKGWEVWMRVKP